MNQSRELEDRGKNIGSNVEEDWWGDTAKWGWALPTRIYDVGNGGKAIGEFGRRGSVAKGEILTLIKTLSMERNYIWPYNIHVGGLQQTDEPRDPPWCGPS